MTAVTASGVDVIVHLGRLPDHTRKVLEICEVEDRERNLVLTPVFVFDEAAERLTRYI